MLSLKWGHFNLLKWALVFAIIANQSLSTRTAIAQSVPSAAASSPASSTSSSAVGGAGGGGGSGIAIESVMLEYQSVSESAARIALQLNQAASLGKTNGYAVVATQADIQALSQLRVVLAQGDLIAYRLNKMKGQMNGKTFHCYGPKPTTQPAQRTLTTPYLLAVTSPADLQTLIGTIASLAAVNMTISPAVGSLADSNLINLVVSNLPVNRVYVPSVYVPNLLSTNDANISESLLYKELQKVEDSRDGLYGAADALITNEECDPSNDKNKETVAEITAEVTAASTQVDTYETSLFSGSNPGPASTGSPTVGNNAPANSSGASGGGTSSPPTQAASATTPLAGTVGTSLAALLNADYLQRAVSGLIKQKFTVYLVSLHALESGGSTVTQTNIFSGSQIFYSGGAVSTFSISNADGTILCSGSSYAYRGLIHAKDLSNGALRKFIDPGVPHKKTNSADNPEEVLPNVVQFTSTCPSHLPGSMPATPIDDEPPI